MGYIGCATPRIYLCQRVDAERVKALDKEIGVLLGRFGVRGKDEALHMRVGMRADDVVQQRGAFGRERDHARGHLGLAQQDLQPALPFGLRPPREQAFIVLRRVPRRGARDGFVPRVVREADDRQARIRGRRRSIRRCRRPAPRRRTGRCGRAGRRAASSEIKRGAGPSEAGRR